MSDASTLRSGVGRRAKSKTMPDVIDDVQQKSPKKMVSKSSSKLNLLAKDSSVKSRRQSSKTRQEEIAAQKSEQESAKIQARPSAARPMTEAEREKEEKVLQVFQTAIDQVKEAIVDKQIIFGKLKAELTRMMRVFEKLHALGASASVDAIETEQTYSLHELSVAQRKELMEKGPFNLVFHGVEPDWIEAEMDDDPDFQRDVLEQKIKAIVRDEVGILRDVGILDCYRFKQGVPLRGAYPVIVTFKARREKEQILWRAKDKLRKKNIFVTEDSQARLSDRLKAEKEKEKDKDKTGKGGGLKKSQSTAFDFPGSPTRKWPANANANPNPNANPKSSRSVAASPKKKAKPAPRPVVGAPALLKNLQNSKSLSKLELEDLFDML